MAIPSLGVPTGTGEPMGASAPVEEIVKAATVWSRVFITRSSPDWFTKTLARVPGPLPTVKGDPGTGVRAPVDESMLNDSTRLAFDSEANRNRFSLKSVTCSRNEGDAPATVGKGEPEIGESDPSEFTEKARMPPTESPGSEAYKAAPELSSASAICAGVTPAG